MLTASYSEFYNLTPAVNKLYKMERVYPGFSGIEIVAACRKLA